MYYFQKPCPAKSTSVKKKKYIKFITNVKKFTISTFSWLSVKYKNVINFLFEDNDVLVEGKETVNNAKSYSELNYLRHKLKQLRLIILLVAAAVTFTILRPVVVKMCRKPVSKVVNKQGPVIALIDMSRAAGLDEMFNNFSYVTNVLTKLRDDNNIAMAVFVVDSGGGSAIGTKAMTHLISSIEKVKPVYFIVDGICASKCYFAAIHSDGIIMSDNESVVGGVGAVYTSVNVKELHEKLGIKVRNFTLGNAPDKLFAYRMHNGSITDEEIIENLMKKGRDKLSAEFALQVFKMRNIKNKEHQDLISSGGAFVNQEALNIGLADIIDLRDYRSIIQDLARRIGLSKNTPVVRVETPQEFADMSQSMQQQQRSTGRMVKLPSVGDIVNIVTKWATLQ